jgi:large subunit ribosomal protein L31e
MSAGEFEERVLTVPLRDAKAVPKHERADKAVSIVRDHIAQHFSVDGDAVRLDPSINEALWERGRKKPPSSLRVRAARFDEVEGPVVEAEHAA